MARQALCRLLLGAARQSPSGGAAFGCGSTGAAALRWADAALGASSSAHPGAFQSLLHGRSGSNVCLRRLFSQQRRNLAAGAAPGSTPASSAPGGAAAATKGAAAGAAASSAAAASIQAHAATTNASLRQVPAGARYVLAAGAAVIISQVLDTEEVVVVRVHSTCMCNMCAT